MVGVVSILLLCALETQSLNLEHRIKPREKRAVFDIIPKLEKQRTFREEELTDAGQEMSPGSRCKCRNGSEKCVLDSRYKCRPLLNLFKVEEKEEEEVETRRHVKRRLSNLVMTWIRMKDAEQRVLEIQQQGA